jgi:signal transduction histidine kinase/DNA-binding response OmpR family regulator
MIAADTKMAGSPATPARDRAGRALAPSDGASSDSPAVHALVVEDDADQAELVRRTLERQNFRVTVVGDGPRCFDAIAQHAYSVILLDYSLPRMNGLEVMAGLRARGFAAPVVMVTAQGDERLAIELMKAGGMDFVVKTSGYLAALPTVLRKVLKQHELAVENDRLHRETERRLHDAEALVELSRTLGSSLDLDALLGVIGRAAARATGMERCSIFDCREGRARLLVSQHASGTLDTDVFARFRGDEGSPLADLPFLASALDRRDAVLLVDPARDPLGSDVAAPAPRTVLVLPLFRLDAASGALVLDRQGHREAPTASEIALATTVASHVGLALENARLYAETQRTLADLKDAQDRLVRGETLRALGELASGAAHHLNNLLAIIAGRSQLLLRTASSPELRRPIEIIERSARDGSEVVRRIQEFARTRHVQEAQPVDLNEIATDVVEMVRPRWHDGAVAAGIEIDVSCELGTIPPVMAHPASLREMVTNLLLNAIDALPEGGHIGLGTVTEGRHVVLTVNDDGVGMTEEVRRRAIEPFFTTKGVKSTGLGLSVNYGILQRYQGSMTIESAVGRGTTVTIRLPAAASEEEAHEPDAAVATEQGKVLLLVDDEPEVREAIGELLQAVGHTVIHAEGGRQALAQLSAGLAPDLVLTDLGMPGMTGRELARTIKSRWPELPVGLVTGWGYAPGSEPPGGADFIMSKPVNLDRLLEVIDGFTGRGRS